MIEIESEGINLLERTSNAKTGELIQYITLTSTEEIDQAFLNHIEQAVHKYNKDMYEKDISKTIQESAQRNKEESIFMSYPASLFIREELQKKGYLRTYEEFRDGGYL